MKTKLILQLDEDLVRRATEYSYRVGKPLSQLVEDYFRALTSKASPGESVSPLVESLRGCIKESGVDEGDDRKHLEGKHR